MSMGQPIANHAPVADSAVAAFPLVPASHTLPPLAVRNPSLPSSSGAGTSVSPLPTNASGAQTSNASPASASDRIIKRRAPVACRRCRRMRSKCVHFGAKPPCEGCRIAGVSLDECVFPTRGAPDLDREYRHPRMKGDKARRESIHVPQSASSGGGVRSTNGLPTSPATPTVLSTDAWDYLPPLEQIVDAVKMFTSQYFQLGFIPKKSFINKLRTNPRSTNPFLLLGILSVSARLTPSLVAASGDAVTAAEFFMDRASTVALTELYREPTLPRCQAFYLLSIAQQGSGYKNNSYINLGIAIRMAILMQLHREETYALPDATVEIVQEAESARRTLWMLHSQDNLHAAPLAPVSLAASDITTLLPSNEEDFANGVLPKSRAALAETQPASENPRLAEDPDRSLFATLIQSHQIWGLIARRAVRHDKSIDPWDDSSGYAKIQRMLREWEAHLPKAHRWSRMQLKEFKAEGCDLAYLAVTMVTRLCNIIIRKAYIVNILRHSSTRNMEPQGFWRSMSRDLFSNVKELFDQIDFWFHEREPGDSTGAQIAIFCVYSCGWMAVYLCAYPNLCPSDSITREGRRMLNRTLDILAQSKAVWPLARRWLESLEKFAAADLKSRSMVSNHPEGSMAEGKDPIPSALHPPVSYSSNSGPPKAPLDDRRHVARQLGADGQRSHPHLASPNSNHLQGKPPQIRRKDSLMNATKRLPPPQLSPMSSTTTSAPASQYQAALEHSPQHYMQFMQQQQQPQPQPQQSPQQSQQTQFSPLTLPPLTPPELVAPLMLPQPQQQQQLSSNSQLPLPRHMSNGAGGGSNDRGSGVPANIRLDMSAAAATGMGGVLAHGSNGTGEFARANNTVDLSPVLPADNLNLPLQAYDTQASVGLLYRGQPTPSELHTLALPHNTVPVRSSGDLQPFGADNSSTLPSADPAASEGFEEFMRLAPNDDYDDQLRYYMDSQAVMPVTMWGSGTFAFPVDTEHQG